MDNLLLYFFPSMLLLITRWPKCVTRNLHGTAGVLWLYLGLDAVQEMIAPDKKLSGVIPCTQAILKLHLAEPGGKRRWDDLSKYID
jgi:hypothetical protein